MPHPTMLPLISNLVLNPAARVLWRGSQSLQLELGDSCVVVDGIDRPTVQVLLRRALATDPRAEPEEVRGFDPEALEVLLDEGFLWHTRPDDVTPIAPPTPRLAADLTALGARHGAQAAGMLTARRQRSIAVTGRGRAAVHIACLLAASGVGHVYFTDSGDVQLSQTMPGGLLPDTEGRRFATAAAAAVRRAAPEADVTPAPMGTVPDLTVLATDEPIDSDQRQALHDRGCAHLVVRLGGASGAVGPLVVPGRTGCLHCADLHRHDRDPDWHALAVQLTVPPHRGAPSEVGAAAVLGGVAALQALDFFDTGTCAAVDGTIELHLPDWRLRRRSWPRHTGCDCATRRS